MKKIIVLFAIFASTMAFSQVGIGTNAPSTKSILDLTATDKGFLLPRMTSAQRIVIVPNNTTDRGMQVYDTDTLSIWYWNGTTWIENGGKNIYISNGSISGARVVTMPTGSTMAFIPTGTQAVNQFSIDGSVFSVNTLNDRVGIGTNTPQVQFNVANTLRVGALTTEGYVQIEKGTTSQAGFVGFHRNNGTRNGYIGWDNANMLYNAENAANHIFSGGNVGIANNSPTARLHISGTPGSTLDLLVAQINNCGGDCGQGTARNVILTNSNSTNSFFASLDFVPGASPANPSGASIIGIDRDGTNHFAGLAFFTRNATNYDQRITIRSSGNVGIGNGNPLHPLHMGSGAHVTAAGVWINASDARLKTNVTNTNYGLKEVLNLRPVQYVMKNDSSKQVGFIAQEVKQIIPEVVSGIEGDIQKGETLGIAYGNLVPVLTKAIQEQQKQIDELKAEIKILKQRN